jgi:hypothetical protein
MGRQDWAWRGNVDGSRIVLSVVATLPAAGRCEFERRYFRMAETPDGVVAVSLCVR